MEKAEDEFPYIFRERNYKISKTKNLPSPNIYAEALLKDHPGVAYDEETVEQFKGVWRSSAFKCDAEISVDLEIGTGNGFHFAHHCEKYLDRKLIGLELKYKPLIQTVRRAVKQESRNFIVARYDARMIQKLFNKEELDNVYIHFPDPWAKKPATLKHRLVQVSFLNHLYELQKNASFVDFKTDHHDYYRCVKECLKHTKYKITRDSEDLHNSQWASENFQTHFEKLWTSKGIKSNYLRFEKLEA